jgi:hypothetical protein
MNFKKGGKTNWLGNQMHDIIGSSLGVSLFWLVFKMVFTWKYKIIYFLFFKIYF